MKLAFLFLTVDDHRQGPIWNEFFRDAPPHQFSTYCHPKHPERVTQPFLRIVPQTVDACHADISLVRATLLLIQYALQDAENQFLILVSDSCVPLYDFARIREIVVERDASWIAYGHDRRDEHRERYYWLADKETFAFENFQKQHQWMVLRRDAAEQVLAHDHTAAFKPIYAPDEHYFATVLTTLGIPIYNQMCTWVNWDDFEKFSVNGFTKLRPKTYETLSLQDVLAARSRGCLFLRKITAACDCSALTSDAAWGPELMAHRDGVGWSVVLMSGLRDARGEWIHIVHDDTGVQPEFYDLMRGDWDVAFCRYTSIDEEGRVYAPDLLGDAPMDLPDDWAAAFLNSNPLTLPAVAFHRRVFERVGLPFEDLTACGDWEMLARAAMGFKWRYVPQRLIVHHEHGAGVSDEERRLLRERMAIMWRRHLPNRSLPRELRGNSPIFSS